MQKSDDVNKSNTEAMKDHERIITDQDKLGINGNIDPNDSTEYEIQKKKIEEREARLAEKERLLSLEEEKLNSEEALDLVPTNHPNISFIKNNSANVTKNISICTTNNYLPNMSVLNASYMNRTENTEDMDARLLILEREKNKLDKEKKLLEDEEKR